ncbi:HPP family protein [Thermosulfurimonas marina]|uniref:HPP family protein n=1 Tax=Thermosulfurimonas marina TaxID=2047767 RepID=UPI00144AE76F|nr:HPP family protein [Thermosulfurimonas marina]
MSRLSWEIAKLFRWRFFYQATRWDVRKLTALYVLSGSFLSLSTLGFAAYFLNWPLIFPALGPTAFLIFYSPARSISWPRNSLLGHLLALACGLGAYFLLVWLFPEALKAESFTLTEIFLVCGAVALTGLLLVLFNLQHPPAAATAMLAAAGYFSSPENILGFLLALILLLLEGLFLHRLSGVVYPLWTIPGEKEEPPIRTKLGEVGEGGHLSDPYARLAHRLTTRRG